MLRKMKGIAAAILIFAAAVPSASAVSVQEEVGAPPPEVYQAALSVLTPYGIDKQDPEKFVVESNWIEDSVERKQKRYIIRTQKKFARRYRVKVTLTPWPRYAVIKIEIDPRYRPIDSAAFAPWRKLSSARDDYELAREYFHRILTSIEAARAAQHA
ncbi:MAG TPA: hypothetical protein VL688_05460 [Verrucomicrobiae bacterium]|jgi:hypothetical protein|nr:hypothetical protein [Verrucomicrobiae bacterium]